MRIWPSTQPPLSAPSSPPLQPTTTTAPPKALAFPDDKFHPSLTMRQKTEQLTKEDSCMVCHAVINPLGFSLENYDAVGRYRTRDNNKPVNTETDYPTSDGNVVELKGPRDLAKFTADSAEVTAIHSAMFSGVTAPLADSTEPSALIAI